MTLPILIYSTGVITSLLTLAGFLGSYAWFLDLSSHFKIQYIIILSFLTLYTIIKRQPIASIAFGLCLVINISLVAPLFMPQPKIATASGSTMTALLINVNSANQQYDQVIAEIKHDQPDILVLEEINPRWNTQLANVKTDYPFQIESIRDDNFGIKVFSKLPIHNSEILYFGSAHLPSISLNIKLDQQTINIIATHPPPPINANLASFRNQQLLAIADHIKILQTPVILIGDLNLSPWSHFFHQILARGNLHNSLNGFGSQMSWPTQFLPLGLPIDHILHTKDLVTVDRQIGNHVGSDHYPVFIKFKFRHF